jgi:hypothetical protein
MSLPFVSSRRYRAGMDPVNDEKPSIERDDLLKRQTQATERTYQLVAVLLGLLVLAGMFVLMASQSSKF